jgi:hypothetical protein
MAGSKYPQKHFAEIRSCEAGGTQVLRKERNIGQG